MTECRKNQIKLCGKEECKVCFERSFAGYTGKTKKGKFKKDCLDLSKHKGITPRNITKGTKDKYHFKCDECNHSFEMSVGHITRPNVESWCNICSGRKLCGNYSCQKCKDKSLLSVDFKNKQWSKKNKLNPIEISVSSDKSIFMDCKLCNHELYIQAKSLKKGYDCKYCSHFSLCDNNKCNFCFNNSFLNCKEKISNDKFKVDCWDYEKNKKKPRDVAISSSTDKYWFKCDNCPHSFKTCLSYNSWCPYCSIPSKKFCNDDKCNFCHNNSFASFSEKTKNGKLKIECLNNEQGNCNPRYISKGSSKKYLFKCDNCNHNFKKIINNITNGKVRGWCPYCVVPSKIFCDNYLKNYKDCVHCYAKSFDAHPKSKYLDNDKNKDKNFKYIIGGGIVKYWFKCNKCNHSFDAKLSNVKTGYWCPYCSNAPKLCDNKKCNLCINNSFASCKEKTPTGKLKVDCWNYEKNKKKPIDVAISSSTDKYWFKCDNCFHGFRKILSSISKSSTAPQWCPYCCTPCNELCKDNNCSLCYANSFASYKGETSSKNLIINCFNKQKNNCTPRNVIKGSNKKYWFNCIDCKHELYLILADITHNNSWCAYCSKPCQKICTNEECKFCYNNSFASYNGKTQNGILKVSCWNSEKNNNINPRNIIIGTPVKYWFKCDNCPHLFDKALSQIVKGNSWCRYCCNNSRYLCDGVGCNVCYKKSFASITLKKNNESIIDYWHNEKNANNTPRNTSKMGDKYIWFKCDKDDLHIWKTCIKNITRGNWCPFCKNKTEVIFQHWFHEKYSQYKLKHQPKYDWCKNPDTGRYLPFDFAVDTLKLIIEVDGEQHFSQISNWQSHEDTFEYDKHKMELAMKNGYSIIRILQDDIWNNKNRWKDKFEKVFQSYKDPEVICIGCEIKYKKYLDIINEDDQSDQEKATFDCTKCNKSFKFESGYKKHCQTKSHKK